MKFVYNFYVIIIILRSAWVVQNAADFTLEELKKISLKLNPVECMRLIEAIYLAIPVKGEHRIVRDTPANTWISKHDCLEELRAWSTEYPDELEPKARVVMFLHLTALGRSDLANYVSKNRRARSTFGKVDKNTKTEENNQKNHETNKKKSYNRRHPHAKKVNHRFQHRRSNRYNIRHPMIATVAGGPSDNEVTAATATGKSQPAGRWNQATSKNSLFLMIALVLVLVFICVIIYLIVRRSLGNCMCCCKRSDLHMGNKTTRQRGLQCVCLNDDRDSLDDFEPHSNQASQTTEIDVEGGSSVDSIDFEDRKSYSDTMLCQGMNTSRVSVERLNLFDDEPAIVIVEETQPLSSCRCRPLEQNIRCTKSKKKKKKKCKDETRTAKSCLKAVHEKILPRQRCKVQKESSFDMKEFQQKILAVLNQECGDCQCCNCSLRLGEGGSKLEEKRPKQERKEQKGEKVGDEIVSYQVPVISRSPTSAKRSHRNQESDSGKKCVVRKVDKVAEKCVSSKTKRVKNRQVIVSSSSSSEVEIYNDNESKKDGGKRRKSKSKRSKHREAR